MYLKRLELHGFKSFASRTRFDFGQGMTAIVGPNGSGKSNISDSLRWVLGEQSGRLLRARKLEDVIYAGSAKRQPADRVEVSITLDNGGRWLPIDIDEVTISRRGVRSGDSDYFINRKKARLREVQELLMKATASQSSYAIIGQGLVESVLNLRPDERRLLVEEAADIQRYRLKIEDARDRLRLTHENVERVRLLMAEIAPRLNQLERQAKRAGEHSRISGDLSRALQIYYEHYWHRAHESLTVSRAGHDQAQAEFVQAKVALETCQRELADVSERLEENRRAAAAVQSERERLDQHIRDLERRTAVAKERAGILEARLEELQEELEALAVEGERASGLLENEDENRENLEKAVAAAREALTERQSEMSAVETDLRDALGHAADERARARRLETAAAEMKARQSRLADDRRTLERDVSRLDARRRSLVTQIAEQLRLLRGHRAQESQIVADVTHSGTRRTALELEVQNLREQLAAVDSHQSERKAKIEALSARLTVLEDAQKQVEASQPGDVVTIEGALATVYEVIRVPRGLEDAIAAALEDQLEAFVFERRLEAIAAIEGVVQQGGPRTSAIALDGLKQVYPLALMKEKGVLGVAARLVKYDRRYEKLVNTLLGRVVVVQDVEVAARLLRRGLGTIVTVNGILLHPTGYVTGGTERAQRSFVLGYERDLEAIPKELERIRRSLEIADRDAGAIRQRLRDAELALMALVSEAEQGLERRTLLGDTLSQRQQKLAHLRGELAALMGQRAAVIERFRGVGEESARLEQEQGLLLVQARECEETADYLERANSLTVERRDALRAAVNGAAEAVARADADLRSLILQRETSEASLARLEAQASAKAVQARGLDMELATLKSSVRADDKELGQARAELDMLLDSMQPGREGAHHLEARQKNLHSQVLGAQNRMFEAERHVLEFEAEVRRWQTDVETLRSRIAEDGLELTAEGDVSPVAVEVKVPSWLAARGEDEVAGPRAAFGGGHVDLESLERDIGRLRGQLRGLGPVNTEAQIDYETLQERHGFLSGQVNDLARAEESLERAIEDLTGLMKKRFETTFDRVARGFEANFQAFFGGGHARLKLIDSKEPGTSGVEIEARPPGKRTHSLSQLSGGEKALTAVSLLFALLEANPSPFCVLDEVDAMLDEANVGRFASALKELAKRTQFIVITHNRRTIEVADSIYGVSMAPDAASRVLSMRLGDVTAEAAALS